MNGYSETLHTISHMLFVVRGTVTTNPCLCILYSYIPAKKVWFSCTVHLAGWLAKMKKVKLPVEPIGRIRKARTALLNFLGMDDDTAWYTGYCAYRLQATYRLQIPLS